MFRAPALALTAIALLAAPSAAGEDATLLRKALALCDEWADAPGDAGRLSVEAEAAKLAPLTAAMVKPVSERLFAIAGRDGPKLKAKAYLYDDQAKKGLYMVSGSGRKPAGLLIAMHGGGEGSGDANTASLMWSAARNYGMTVIAPEVMTKVSSAWAEEPEERFVLDLIAAAKRTWDIDTNRVYLAGHSMGGDGAWMIGGRNADLLAGCAPLAGSVMPYMKGGAKNKRDTSRTAYAGLMEGVVPNLMHLHFWIYHSADDENEAITPDDMATGYLKQLKKMFPGRYDHFYDRADGNGHAAPPGGVRPVLEWLGKTERTPYPAEVVWETWRKWKRQMYWLYHPAPVDAWRFYAKVVGPNHVEVSAMVKPVAGHELPKSLPLTLLVSPKLFDLEQPLRVTCDDTLLHDWQVPRTLWSLMVSIGRRNDPAQWFEGHATVTVPCRGWTDLWDD